VRAHLVAWWRGRSDRERRLLGLALLATALATVAQLGVAVAHDLARARARLAAQEHDLTAVRRLARELAQHHTAIVVNDDTPLVTRLEAAAAGVIGRERIASMTPMVGARDGVALRLVGTSLGEAVQVLYGIERGGNRVEKLDLVKHPDDPSRFDVTLEVAGAARP
jgi:type II secretory pathway component PulM